MVLQVSQTPPATADLAYTDLLNAFMAFPAPLALLDANGCSERVNTRFLQRFGKDGVNTAQLRAEMHDAQGGWQRLGLPPCDALGGPVRARAVCTASHIFLIVDETADAAYDVEPLRKRIGELEHLAATDTLTGAWNRAHLDLVIESVRARSLASRRPLSLVVFDIDQSKSVNDGSGHAVGDSTLRELVQLVRSRIRASDLLFRWGVNEFAVLVSSAGYHGAERVAENLRQVVDGHAFDGVGAMTVRLSVAEHDGDEDVPTWFRRLEEGLYEAKRSGGNGIIVSRRGNSDTWAAEGGSSALHLVWQESYESGDPTIDMEHRGLFQLGNILIDAAMCEREDPEAVRAALGDLLAHVVRHFADEEAILERLNYAHLPDHRQAHEGLVRRARMMARLIKEGKASPDAVVEFLTQDVIARHMMVVDRAFFPMFRNGARATFAAQTS